MGEMYTLFYSFYEKEGRFAVGVGYCFADATLVDRRTPQHRRQSSGGYRTILISGGRGFRGGGRYMFLGGKSTAWNINQEKWWSGGFYADNLKIQVQMASFKAIDVFIFCCVQCKSVFSGFLGGSVRHFTPSLPSGSATVTESLKKLEVAERPITLESSLEFRTQRQRQAEL